MPHRKGINSLAIINQSKNMMPVENSTKMFSASRDRYIKLWEVNYSSRNSKGKSTSKVDLLANLDGHTDWVN